MSQIKHVSVGLIVGITSLAMLAFTGCDVGVGDNDLMARANALKGTSTNDDDEGGQPKKKAVPKAPPKRAERKQQKPIVKPKKADGTAIKEKTFVAASKDPVKLPPAKTEENLKTIFNAMRSISRNQGFPPFANLGKGREPLLSWRVHILPALGYEELYKKFNKQEPWDSNHNLGLLEQMPQEFQSSGVGQFKTTYLVPRAAASAFSRPRVTGDNLIEDGVANTVVIVDASPEHATEWTRPIDLHLKARLYRKTLASQGNFNVVWGNGRVSKIKSTLNEREYVAMISIDGGEPISLSRYSVEPPVKVDDAKAKTEEVADNKGTTTGPLDAT